VLPAVLLLHAAASCLGAAEISGSVAAAAVVPWPPESDPFASCGAPSRADRERPPAPPPHALAPAEVDHVREPSPRVSLDWALFQLLPSPGVAIGEQGARFGLRWQLTPVLYSFALDARLSRWRWFVVEPVVRQSGSVELFVAPEYLALDGGLAERLGVRAGLRSYFGVIQRGDYLSLSLGSSYYQFPDARGVSIEAGAQILFGALGLFVEHSPGFDAAPWYVSLRLRYF
jgi:hypothetical protein